MKFFIETVRLCRKALSEQNKHIIEEPHHFLVQGRKFIPFAMANATPKGVLQEVLDNVFLVSTLGQNLCELTGLTELGRGLANQLIVSIRCCHSNNIVLKSLVAHV